jgi:hypothetical protein
MRKFTLRCRTIWIGCILDMMYDMYLKPFVTYNLKERISSKFKSIFYGLSVDRCSFEMTSVSLLSHPLLLLLLYNYGIL